ncbi:MULTISPECIES: replicative DNA helicase [Methylophaga]|uniref:Replicative DNA helicase n=3 Tax=Methylophaga TaxID=40222 RepID=I1XHG5_METNJ|nr:MULTISPECIES: replicative DNA helicase [Methylophaga]AFI83834.1 replicative DNA helicase [Methylophaga nitratireducenticrescens]AUZ83953.1 replicative DNA helicase [Methylophaga nitratireducenticrescens]MAL50267.1 replicative DNA helicase [Methylophaga sp.]MAP28268.1 replicative DNA helicase [Methylophaga sp.]MBP26443.1 replicative DNA helicase [Methylophaga sp.]
MEQITYPESYQDSATQALKVPPHSVEAEQSVLGGLMLDNSAWEQVSDLLVEQDFYRHDHQLIFRGIAELMEQANPVDVITLAEWHNQRGELDKVGELAYLGALARNTPSAANIKAYASIVRERSILRQLIQIGNNIANMAFTPEGRNSEEMLDTAERRVFEIAEKGAKRGGGFIQVKDVLSKVVDKIDTLFEQDSGITGLPTGFIDFDDQTSGLQPADLVIIAGRPSMGKTTFAMNIAENAAIHSKQPVAVFSMEMPADSLAMRMLSSLGRIDQHRLRTGRLNDDDWPRLTSAIALLNEAPLFIDDTGGLTPSELRARARRLKREHGLSLIIVDYLQLMSGSANGRQAENRTNEISEISRSLKALAKELNVPVIALSQLNRSLEQRPNKRPVMSDLRESGAIEQDADIIVFIYRDEVYNEDSAEKGKAEIIISKQRNGPIGTVALTFQGKYTRFENFAPAYYQDYGDNES